ncbi:MAG: hypothetical protein M3P44_04745 [Actinomycetota bacterium]|nr:hypothetical protein [Actinomycetota bacterium]
MAWASHIAQVDPASVPYGALVAQNQVRTPLKIKVGDQPSHRLSDGSVVYIRHVTAPPGQSSGWHTHAGPALVTIVKGSLTLYDAPARNDDDETGDDEKADQACAGATYAAGQGFIDAGFGHVHLAIAGSQGADFYQTLILPPDSSDTLATPAPAPADPACPRG